MRHKRRVRIPPFRPRAHASLDAVLAEIGTPEPEPFTPDPFQLEALAALQTADCLVSAPTGSGKTWIAEQAMARALERSQRSWYASPLKALSNSKLVEFSEIFGPEKVGILTGQEHLYFYDAIAPIVEADSIDRAQVYAASRYDRGGADYLNCPFDKEQYLAFVKNLCNGAKVAPHNFEKAVHFEGCMPIEVLAERGEMTLAFGPMKPVGLRDPRTGREPFAVVQLRQDDKHASLYNLVGFQTKLTYPEQERIFRTIPGLEQANFARLGSMHRNTFINGPACLSETLQLKTSPNIFFSGQITGVEGYVESAASGFLAGLSAAAYHQGKTFQPPPQTTALGALLRYPATATVDNFQPMNITYGLFPDLEQRIRKRRDRRQALAERALADLETWRTTLPAQLSTGLPEQ